MSHSVGAAGARVAIDGPAASGKSTLGTALARALDFRYFDSGVLYRALAWLALDTSVDPADEARLKALAEAMVIDVRSGRIAVNGRDVTQAIRTPHVDASVSPVSLLPGVRDSVTRRLREIAAPGSIVMVGRDIGTVVLPDAELKIFLTASAEERARRRCSERAAGGEPADYASTLAAIQQRDAIDSGRAAAPLRAAPDAIVINSDHLSPAEEVGQALEHLRRRGLLPAGASVTPADWPAEQAG